MSQNKIVVRYQDGRILKGHTSDFLPTKPLFHVTPQNAPHPGLPIEVRLDQVKAVFFVKDLVGDPKREERREFPAGKAVIGRKIQVIFPDGERLLGTTQGYDPARLGFFVIPADPDCNNTRCFVITRATQRVCFL